MEACNFGHKAIVELLLTVPSLDLEAMNIRGQRADEVATSRGHDQLSQLIQNKRHSRYVHYIHYMMLIFKNLFIRSLKSKECMSGFFRDVAFFFCENRKPIHSSYILVLR